MEPNVLEDGDVTIVELAGNIDIASAASIDENMSSLIDGGTRKLLLDFSRVKYVASMGLRMLIKTGKRLEAEDGSLRICCTNDTVDKVFAQVGLDAVIPVFDNKELALDDLK